MPSSSPRLGAVVVHGGRYDRRRIAAVIRVVGFGFFLGFFLILSRNERCGSSSIGGGSTGASVGTRT